MQSIMRLLPLLLISIILMKESQAKPKNAILKTVDVTLHSVEKIEMLNDAIKFNGEWSEWDNCSQECGGGNQTRNRQCSSPTPQNGGKSCEITEQQECNVEACPINGEFSEWSEWSECSQECGGGSETRNRQCDSPTPQNGGKDCEGELEEQQDCNVEACPINGGFSDWSEWSICSQECDSGSETRTRQCNNPIPQNGGDDCEGELTEKQECYVKACMLVSEGKSASQSSQFSKHYASTAVDGNHHRSYTHTLTSTNPWWQLDLGSVHQITKLTVYNRVDCCGERLGGFKVQVSSNSGGPFTECASGPATTTTAQIINLNCVTVGKFVRITIPGSDKTLSLCEVKIFGSPK